MKSKTEKSSSTRKTKMENIMYRENISLEKMHEETGIANPTLLNIKKGRKTDIKSFRKRTIRDLEKYLSRPADQFIGWEDEPTQPISDKKE